MAEYRNPYQWNNQAVEWDLNAPKQSPWGVTFEQVNPGYISGLMQLRQRVRAGQASEAERAEYARMEQAARAIPMRDPASLQFGWNNDEPGSWNEGGSDWWKMINGSSPDLGPVMLTIADRIEQGTATPHERGLFQQTMAYDQDWNYRASVPQASDAWNPMGDNLFGALSMLAIGATGGMAAAPLATGGALTLASVGGLLAAAGGITGMLAEPLDSEAMRMAGLAMGAAGGVTSLASLLSNGLNSVGDVVKAVQKVYGTTQKGMALVQAAQQGGNNPAVLAQAQQQSQGRQVGSNSQALTSSTGGTPVAEGNILDALAPLLAGAVGAVGTGISLADVNRYMEQLKTRYGQEEETKKLIDDAYKLAVARYETFYAQTQEERAQKQEAYKTALERYDTRYTQQQQQFEKQQQQFDKIEGQTDRDRNAEIEHFYHNRERVDEAYNRQVQEAKEERDYQVARDSANVAKYDAAFQRRVQLADEYRTKQYQNFDDQYQRHIASQDQRAAQAVQERGLDLNAYQQRQSIGRNMSDPAALKAGAEALYQPLSALARDRVNVQTEEEMARRGVAGGGMMSNYMAAKAFAPQEQTLWTNALNAYLTGQRGALDAYTQQDLTMSPEYRMVNMPQFTDSPEYRPITAPNLQGSPGYTPVQGPRFTRSSMETVPQAPGYNQAPGVPDTRYDTRAAPTVPGSNTYYPDPYEPWGTSAKTGGGAGGPMANLGELAQQFGKLFGGNQGLAQQAISAVMKLLGGGGGGMPAWADSPAEQDFLRGGGDETQQPWYDPAYMEGAFNWAGPESDYVDYDPWYGIDYDPTFPGGDVSYW